MGFIYKISNTKNDKLYVGQTTKNLCHRFSAHIRDSKRKPNLLYNAMRKHGVEIFRIDLLEECGNDELNNREMFWIKELSAYKKGYNMTTGGDINPTSSPLVRKKISDSRKGKKATAETKRKLSECKMGDKNHFYGKKHTEKTKSQISKNHGMRGMFGKLHPNSKPVYRLDKSTEEVLEEYESIGEALRWLKKRINIKGKCTGITQMLSGAQKTAYGYKWKFKNQ